MLKEDVVMKSKSYSLLLVAGLILLCLVGWTAYAQKDNPSQPGRIVWEYKTVRAQRGLSEPMLNDMGLYGWELVMFDDGARGNGSYEATFYFKRPK
jgi:hypothetical protein